MKNLISRYIAGGMLLASLGIPLSVTAAEVNQWYALNWSTTPTVYSIDKTTGEATAVYTVDSALPGSPAGVDIAVDGQSLFAYYITYNSNPDYNSNPASLVRIDLVNGSQTIIKELSDAGETVGDATAFDIGTVAGKAYFAADFGVGFGLIDLATGAVTQLNPLGSRISALATSPTGTLYAITYTDNALHAYDAQADSWTQVRGNVGASIMAADFDNSGKLLTQEWDGTIRALDIGTGILSDPLVSIAVNGQAFSGEAFAVSGPVDGSSLAQSLLQQETPAEPAPYTGPIVSSVGHVVMQGGQLTLRGERLSGVSQVLVGEEPARILESSESSLILEASIFAKVGYGPIVLISPNGKLTVQDSVLVTPLEQPLSTWTKLGSDGTVAMVAKNVIGEGKVQFMLNGKEIAWVRAEDNSDPKLRFAGDAYYLVRTVNLVQGQKNALEIYVDGQRVWRAAYSY